MVPAYFNSTLAESSDDHMSGRRGRKRATLVDNGSKAFSELDLLEMLANRRGDTKPLAKALMRRCGIMPRQ